MLSFLSWIPILGPIFQGIGSILTPIFSEKATVAKVAGQVTIAETQASVDILHINAANIALRLATDIIVFPVAIWIALVTWDTIVALHYPNWMFHVAGFDKTSAPYLPYAVVTFLLGNIGINMWKLK